MGSIASIGKCFAITGLLLAMSSGTGLATPFVTIIDTGEGAPTVTFDPSSFVGLGGTGSPDVTYSDESVIIRGSTIVHGINEFGGMSAPTVRRINIYESAIPGPVSDTLELTATPWVNTGGEGSTLGYQNITLIFTSDPHTSPETFLTPLSSVGADVFAEIVELGPPDYNDLTAALGLTCQCFSLTVQSEVPEPATLLLLGSGLVGLGLWKRSRRRGAQV